MGKTHKHKSFNDRPSGSFKKDKSSKYRFHLDEDGDNIDEIIEEIEYLPIDYEADSASFNEDGTRKTPEQIEARVAEIENKVKGLETNGK